MPELDRVCSSYGSCYAISSSRNSWLLLFGVTDVGDWHDSVRLEPAETECDMRSAAAASTAAESWSRDEWLDSADGTMELSTTVGSVSSDPVRSMTIFTPVELIGLDSGLSRGEARVLVAPPGLGGDLTRRGWPRGWSFSWTSTNFLTKQWSLVDGRCLGVQ